MSCLLRNQQGLDNFEILHILHRLLHISVHDVSVLHSRITNTKHGLGYKTRKFGYLFRVKLIRQTLPLALVRALLLELFPLFDAEEWIKIANEFGDLRMTCDIDIDAFIKLGRDQRVETLVCCAQFSERFRIVDLVAIVSNCW